MFKDLIKSTARKLGYRIVKNTPNEHSNEGYALWKYRKPNGDFDYERYRAVQKEGNLRKIDNVWVIEENIKFLAGYLSGELNKIEFGICHGTRRGNEQMWFRESLKCEVIGTEISDSATQFPNTVQWDFHEANPEWEGRTDFIYSNSFDHSYDPEACLNTWIDSLKIGGLCVLEHSNLHAPEGSSELDPFGAELEIMPFLITQWAKGRFFVKEILTAPKMPASVRALNFLVIQRLA